MISLALDGVDCSRDQVVVAVLREHEERYRVRRGLAAAIGSEVCVVVHDEPTRNQAETLVRTIDDLGLTEPFLVKDSDNRFRLADVETTYNYVCVESLNNFDAINPRNKSYVQIDHRDVITNIREKTVISDLFSVGGYYFTSPEQFKTYFHLLQGRMNSWNREMYVSDVIGAMILDGIPFFARRVTEYEDWGTIHEWRRSLQARRAFLVLIDGFVFQRGSRHFHPLFEEVEPNAEAVHALRELASQGNSILYLSVRSEAMESLTRQQLKKAGAPEAPILFGCPVASLTLVSSPDVTLPFVTSLATELSPEDTNLLEKLRGGR